MDKPCHFLGYIWAVHLIFSVAYCKDYCQWDRFEPRCPDNQVISIENAHWGRMHKGRCIDKDYGFVGCYTDVRAIVEKKCAGRQTCDMMVPNEELASAMPINGCPKDLNKYLSLNYSCMKVVDAAKTKCVINIENDSKIGNNKRAEVTIGSVTSLPHHYIASQSTESTGCGNNDQPWRIKVQKRQSVNITLHDYNSGAVGYSSCKVYAIIKDVASGKSETICGGVTRVRQVYHAQTTELEIRVMRGNQPKYFLLEYNVLGCPEITAPSKGWVKYESNSAIVGCEDTSLKWILYCKDNKWQEDYGTCNSEFNPEPSSMERGSHFSMNTSLSVIIVLCVAVFLGIFILLAGVLILHRRKYINSQYTRPDAQPPKDLTYYAGHGGHNSTASEHNIYEYVSDFSQYGGTSDFGAGGITATSSVICPIRGHNNPNLAIPLGIQCLESSGYGGTTDYGTLPPDSPPSTASSARTGPAWPVTSGNTTTSTDCAGNVYVRDNNSVCSSAGPLSKYYELDVNSRNAAQRKGSTSGYSASSEYSHPVIMSTSSEPSPNSGINVGSNKLVGSGCIGGGVNNHHNHHHSPVRLPGNSNTSGISTANTATPYGQLSNKCSNTSNMASSHMGYNSQEYKSQHSSAQNSKQNFGHYSQ